MGAAVRTDKDIAAVPATNGPTENATVGTDAVVAERARRPKNRRAQIALAAAELFCERGYPGVGIDDIAEVVGISGPAIYRHFPTKYAMLLHATRELTDEILEAVAVPDPPLSPQRRLDQVVADLARISVERREVGGLYLGEGRHLTAEDKTWLRAAMATVTERVSESIAQLRPELSTSDSEVLARAALGALRSLSTHRAPISTVRAQQLLKRAAWTLIKADPAPAPAPVVEPLADIDVEAVSPRREAILGAALRLFHEDGYHAVSMEEIGRAAGITGSSVYRHFPGKADLLAAVYHRSTQEVAAATAAALARSAGPAEALDRLVDSYVDLVFGHPDLISVYRAAHRDLSTDDRHELRKAQRMHVEEWVRLLIEVRPVLTPTAARILVHTALNVIVDLGRRDLAPTSDRVVATLARTVLRT